MTLEPCLQLIMSPLHSLSHCLYSCQVGILALKRNKAEQEDRGRSCCFRKKDREGFMSRGDI